MLVVGLPLTLDRSRCYGRDVSCRIPRRAKIGRSRPILPFAVEAADLEMGDLSARSATPVWNRALLPASAQIDFGGREDARTSGRSHEQRANDHFRLPPSSTTVARSGDDS